MIWGIAFGKANAGYFIRENSSTMAPIITI